MLAFEEEKRQLDRNRDGLRLSQLKIDEQKEKMSVERKTILEAVAKLGSAEKKLAAKLKDFEEIAEV